MIDFLMWLLVTGLAFNLMLTPTLFLADCIWMFISKDKYQDWCGMFLEKKFEVLGPLGDGVEEIYKTEGFVGWLVELIFSIVAFLLVGTLIVSGVYMYVVAFAAFLIFCRLIYPLVK